MSELDDIRSDLLDIKDGQNSISGLLEAISKKEFYDKEIGSGIKSSLDNLIELLSKPEEPKEYFDKSLGETIKETITQVLVGVTKLGRPNIDLSPVTQIASEVSRQNQSILDVLLKLSRESTDELKYEVLLKNTIAMIGKSNEFLQKGLKEVDYTKELKSVAEAINRRPRSWKFISVKNRDGNFETIAEEIIK